MELSAGTRIGRYEIRSLLGAGGMGEVYQAFDAELKRTVALKFLPAEVAADPKRLERFEREAQAASALNHPNILTVYDIGQTADGRRFFATEFVDGATLREHARARRPKLGEVLDVAAQIAGALVEAHAHGIVHRDIKPENVMVRRDGYVKVLDFGLAKLTGGTSSGVDPEAATQALVVTDAGAVMGTVSYMSPEQSQGLEVDARTDVWSLGVVLYELLTGRLPFGGKSPSHTIVAIQDEEPPPLSAYMTDAPELLQEVVSDALAKDREARLTAKQMLARLQRLKRRLDAGGTLDHSVVPHASGAGGEVSGRSTGRQQHGATGGGAQTTAVAAATAAGGSAAQTVSSTEFVATKIRAHKKGFAVALVAAAVLVAAGVVKLVGVGFLAGRFFGRGDSSSSSPVAPLQQMKFTRLPSGGGQTFGADISPDGKFLVRSVFEAGRESLRLRQVTGTTEKEIVPPAEGAFWSMTFSPDGGSLYYVFKKKDESVGQLYRVSVLGGDAQRLAGDVGGVTLSPDGRRLAFLRYSSNESAIILMNEAGGGEETLLARTPPLWINSAKWSPDGRVLAYVISGTDKEGYYTNIEAVGVADRSTSTVSSARWRHIVGVEWLSDASGLIIAARDRASLPHTPTQLWHVAYPDGAAYKITNDLNFYNVVSLTADSRTALVGQLNLTAHLWVAPGGDSARARQITSGGMSGYQGISWTTDGRILYESDASGNTEIWSAGAGGGGKQLTFDPYGDIYPAASPDGRYVVFLTNRSVGWSLWRMNADGGGARELVGNVDQHSFPHFSPDSRWVFYKSADAAGKTAVWKVSAEGGDPVKIIEKEVWSAQLSPDGKQIAAFHRDPQPNSPLRILIFPAEGGDPTLTLDAPPDTGDKMVSWSPDGKALECVLTRDGASNLWRLPLDGGKARQLTDWKTDFIYWHAWSRDGKQLAVSRGTETADLVLIQNFRN